MSICKRGRKRRRLLANATMVACLYMRVGTAGAFIIHQSPNANLGVIMSKSPSSSSYQPILDNCNTRIPHYHHGLYSSLDSSSGSSMATSSTTSGQHHGQGPDEETIDWVSLPDAPGPIRWPIVGNMITALKVGGIHKFDQVMKAKYGNVVRTKILGFPLYVISTPELTREICTSRYKVGR